MTAQQDIVRRCNGGLNGLQPWCGAKATWVVSDRGGSYRFVCDAHADSHADHLAKYGDGYIREPIVSWFVRHGLINMPATLARLDAALDPPSATIKSAKEWVELAESGPEDLRSPEEWVEAVQREAWARGLYDGMRYAEDAKVDTPPVPVFPQLPTKKD